MVSISCRFSKHDGNGMEWILFNYYRWEKGSRRDWVNFFAWTGWILDDLGWSPLADIHTVSIEIVFLVRLAQEDHSKGRPYLGCCLLKIDSCCCILWFPLDRLSTWVCMACDPLKWNLSGVQSTSLLSGRCFDVDQSGNQRSFDQQCTRYRPFCCETSENQSGCVVLDSEPWRPLKWRPSLDVATLEKPEALIIQPYKKYPKKTVCQLRFVYQCLHVNMFPRQIGIPKMILSPPSRCASRSHVTSVFEVTTSFEDEFHWKQRWGVLCAPLHEGLAKPIRRWGKLRDLREQNIIKYLRRFINVWRWLFVIILRMNSIAILSAGLLEPITCRWPVIRDISWTKRNWRKVAPKMTAVWSPVSSSPATWTDWDEQFIRVGWWWVVMGGPDKPRGFHNFGLWSKRIQEEPGRMCVIVDIDGRWSQRWWKEYSDHSWHLKNDVWGRVGTCGGGLVRYPWSWVSKAAPTLWWVRAKLEHPTKLKSYWTL